MTDAMANLEERRVRFRERLTDALRRSTDPGTIAFQAARVLAQHLGVEQAAYAEIDEAGEYAIIRGVAAFVNVPHLQDDRRAGARCLAVEVADHIDRAMERARIEKYGPRRRLWPKGCRCWSNCRCDPIASPNALQTNLSQLALSVRAVHRGSSET